MSWYRTGTVTLTNGSPNVIGAGTDWLAAKTEAGDAITLADGRDYEIQAVGGDKSMTLTSAYLGASVVGAAYQIKPIATAARLIELSSQAAQLLQTFADVAQRAGVGRFAAGVLVDNVLRPSLRGLIDDDTGINLPGNNVLEQWQGGVKTASVAADGTPSGPMWEKAPISAAAGAAFPRWRGSVGLDVFNFDAALPGQYMYYPGTNPNHPSGPPGINWGQIIVYPSGDGSQIIQVIPDDPVQNRWVRTKWGVNAASPWRQDGAQIQTINVWGPVQEFRGGIKQGPLAPRTAKKLISGVMPGKGGTTAMEHGVQADKIVSVQVECRYGADGSWVGPNADGPNLPASHYRFRTWRGPVAVNAGIDPNEGEALVGKPVQAWIEYIVD